MCDEDTTSHEVYGVYQWSETITGDTSLSLCAFGPVNATAVRECLPSGLWNSIVDYSQCYTLTTMMYQEFQEV